ncbi:MAG: peroxiredoxin [Bdellovibrio sp.]|nr:MAG: peroxiredoxin [Bdellovibrio sp.]
MGTATGGKSIDIANWGHPLVLFFYPKDFTPGCTVESKDFSTRYEDFKKLGVDVIGVSPDTLSSHEKFRDKEGLREDLISDPDKVLCEAFGVIKEKNLYGRKYMGVERSTFVLDKNGVVVQEWRGVKVPGHVDEVYQFVKENREQLL